MSNITLFTLETAKELYNTSEAFPIDFDMAWQVLGYSNKANAKTALINYFERNSDYKVDNSNKESEALHSEVFISNQENNKGGRPTEKLILTVACFKELGMLAKSPEGRQIRQYFLQCEKLAKESHQKLLEQSKHHQKLLKRVALDEEKLEFLKMSERISTKMKDRNGLMITQWQIKAHLEATRPKMKPIEPAKPVFPVPDAIRAKIFESLLKACKGRQTIASDLRANSLMRRKDVLNLYAHQGQKFLRKAEILKMFADAAKHGYGTFDRVELVFNPVLMTSSTLVTVKTS